MKFHSVVFTRKIYTAVATIFNKQIPSIEDNETEHDEEEEEARSNKLLSHLYMVEHTVMIWNWSKFKYGYMNNSKLFFAMWYEGLCGIPLNNTFNMCFYSQY